MSYSPCSTCLKDGYDECLCQFCKMCSSFGHKRDACRSQPCSQCKGRHTESTCPLMGPLIWDGSDNLLQINCWFDDDRNFSDSSLNQEEGLCEDSKRNQTSKTKKVSRTLRGRDYLTEYATGSSITLENLGPVNRTVVLHNLILETKSRYGERYESLFDSEDVTRILEAQLNPAVRDICERGNFTLSGMRAIGQKPGDMKRSGVYLHILWRRYMPERFWLYVGQATNIKDRLKTHNDPYRRRRNPSLHYHVWDSASDMESVFVILASNDSPACPKAQLLLNLQEMWMSLIFQTLTSLSLGEFLPKSMKQLWSGKHLNVALPLWQGFTGNEEQDATESACGGRFAFQQFLVSDDPTIRQWAENARDSFNDIRNSPDPVLRKYYEDLHLQRRLAAQKTWEKKQFQTLRQHLSMARETKVRKSTHGDSINCGKFRFNISKSLRLKLKEYHEVSFQLHLTDTKHPHCYVRDSQPQDPASRLAVSLRGRDAGGPFHVWLKTHGACNVMKMNSLVDILEGFTLEESRTFQRRWSVQAMRPKDKTSRAHVYT